MATSATITLLQGTQGASGVAHFVHLMNTTIATVPEASTLVLCGLPLVGALVWRRKRGKSTR